MGLNTIYTGLIVGMLFGFVLQRGRFCMNSAFRDIVLLEDFTLLKAVGAALLVQMIGFTLMAMMGVIQLNPNKLFGMANIVGSLAFGIGMVLAGGCASGVTYRMGEGMVGAMMASLGLGLGTVMTSAGVLRPVKDLLRKSQPGFTATPSGLVVEGNQGYTLANIVGLPHEIVALVLAILLIAVWVVVARRNRDEDDDWDEPAKSLFDRIFKSGWNWLPTGIAMGVVGMLAFWLSAQTGRMYPLGITGGYSNVVNKFLTGEGYAQLNWFGMLIIGIVLGSLIASLIANEFKLRVPSAGTLLITFVGGILMGFGASTSGGCNIGHILSGIPQLSLGSILAGLCIVLGAWFASFLIFVLPQRLA